MSRARPFFGLAATLLAASALSGCVGVWSVSAPPVGHSAEHATNLFGDDEVHLTRGTVLAFDCVDTFTGAPCALDSMTFDDAKVIEVLPAHLERKPSPWGGSTAVEPRAGFVIVAKKAGETRFSIDASIGSRTVKVVVE